MRDRRPVHRFVKDHSTQSPPAKFTGSREWSETPDPDFVLDHGGAGHHGNGDADHWDSDGWDGGEEYL